MGSKIIWLLWLFISCGQQDFPDYTQDGHFQQEEEEDCSFSLNLKNINPSLARSLRTKAVIWKRSNQFYAEISLFNGPHQTTIHQYIHESSHCPTLRDDLNQDGKIDFTEALKASGKILIPLDGVLKTQKAGLDSFPSTNKEGKYHYSEAGNLKFMLEDLRSEDLDPFDSFIKLTPGDPLGLMDRTIIVYDAGTATLLPLACGEIQ